MSNSSSPASKTANLGYGAVPKIDGYALVTNLAGIGLDNKEIAKCLGISEEQFNNFVLSDKRLYSTLKVAREQPIREVERALFKKAVGFTKKKVELGKDGEVRKMIIEDMCPDMGAIAFFLKNKAPELWQDVMKVSLQGSLADRMTRAHERLAEGGVSSLPEGEGDGEAE